LRQNCEVACQLSTAGRITHSQSGGCIVASTAFCHLISCLSTHKLVLGSVPTVASWLAWRPPAMRKKTRVKRNSNQPKKVLRLPDLEHAKSAVLDSLTSNEGRRCYCHAIDEFVDWYCSEPRLHLIERWGVSSFALTMKRRATGCTWIDSNLQIARLPAVSF